MADSDECCSYRALGIAITTPEVSEERAVVQIKTILRNETSSDRQITLTTKLTKGNDEAGKGEIKVDLPANGIKEITQKFLCCILLCGVLRPSFI